MSTIIPTHPMVILWHLKRGKSLAKDCYGSNDVPKRKKIGRSFLLILLVALSACAPDYSGFDRPNGQNRADHELFVRYLAYLNDSAYKHIMAAYRQSLPDEGQGIENRQVALRQAITPALRRNVGQKVVADWRDIREALAERCGHCHDLTIVSRSLAKEQEVPFWYAVHRARTRLNLAIQWLRLQDNTLVRRIRKGLR